MRSRAPPRSPAAAAASASQRAAVTRAHGRSSRLPTASSSSASAVAPSRSPTPTMASAASGTAGTTPGSTMPLARSRSTSGPQPLARPCRVAEGERQEPQDELVAHLPERVAHLPRARAAQLRVVAGGVHASPVGADQRSDVAEVVLQVGGRQLARELEASPREVIRAAQVPGPALQLGEVAEDDRLGRDVAAAGGPLEVGPQQRAGLVEPAGPGQHVAELGARRLADVRPPGRRQEERPAHDLLVEAAPGEEPCEPELGQRVGRAARRREPPGRTPPPPRRGAGSRPRRPRSPR